MCAVTSGAKPVLDEVTASFPKPNSKWLTVRKMLFEVNADGHIALDYTKIKRFAFDVGTSVNSPSTKGNPEGGWMKDGEIPPRPRPPHARPNPHSRSEARFGPHPPRIHPPPPPPPPPPIHPPPLALIFIMLLRLTVPSLLPASTPQRTLSN